MYTFVYRAFIKFIFFCLGQALDGPGLSCYVTLISCLRILSVSMPSRAWVVTWLAACSISAGTVSMPSRAWVVTHWQVVLHYLLQRFNALSGLYLISTTRIFIYWTVYRWVSMPSRAYTSFLHRVVKGLDGELKECQCPLGLIPHFYHQYWSSIRT